MNQTLEGAGDDVSSVVPATHLWDLDGVSGSFSLEHPQMREHLENELEDVKFSLSLLLLYMQTYTHTIFQMNKYTLVIISDGMNKR